MCSAQGQEGNSGKRIVLTDDHHIVRHAIKTILESSSSYQVVGEANDADSALELAESSRPDIMLLDISLPKRSGIELMHQMKHKKLPTKVVVFTMHEDERKIKQAFENGAVGYILKDSSPKDIVSALDRVSNGEMYLPKRYEHISISENRSSAANSHNRHNDENDPLNILSPREREMFFLLVEGIPNRSIAKKLFISARTVETHRARIIKKLGLKSNADMIKYAVRHNLITP